MGRIWNIRSWSKNRLHPSRFEEIVILLRDHTATDHQNNVDIGALLASQDSNVFRVSSEVANAAEKGEADGDTVVDLNRIGVQEALMPPPTTTNN